MGFEIAQQEAIVVLKLTAEEVRRQNNRVSYMLAMALVASDEMAEIVSTLDYIQEESGNPVRFSFKLAV